MKYKGTIDEVLERVFKDHPDSLVVNGVSWVGEPKLTPWLHAPGLVACVCTDGGDKATGVVVTRKQLDELEMLYAWRFNVRLHYVLNVYDRHTGTDLLPSQTY